MNVSPSTNPWLGRRGIPQERNETIGMKMVEIINRHEAIDRGRRLGLLRFPEPFVKPISKASIPVQIDGAGERVRDPLAVIATGEPATPQAASTTPHKETSNHNF